MLKVPILLPYALMLGLVTICGTAADCRSQTSDAEAVRDTVTRFLAAYQQADADSLSRLWSGKTEDLAKRRSQTDQALKGYELIPNGEIVIGQMTVQDETVAVRLIAPYRQTAPSTSNSSSGGTEALHLTFRMLKKGQSWLVSDFSTTEDEIANAIAGAAGDAQRKKLLEENASLLSTKLIKALVSKGNELYSHGEYPLAKPMYQTALDLAEQLKAMVGPEAADAWLGIGHAEYFQSNYDQAKKYYAKGVEIARQIRYQHALATGLRCLANVRFVNRDYDGALDLYGKSLDLSRSEDDKVEMAKVLVSMGWTYTNKYDTAKALEYYQRSLRLSEETGRKDDIALALISISDFYDSNARYEEALTYCDRALKISREARDPRNMMLASLQLGRSWDYLGDHTRGVEYWRQALALARQIGEKLNTVAALEGLGRSALWFGRYAESLRYYFEALEIDRSLGRSDVAARVMLGIADVYQADGNRQAALRYNQDALEAMRATDARALVMSTLFRIAQLHQSGGDYIEAGDYAQRALKLAVELKDTESEAETYLVIGGIDLKTGDASSALEYAHKALAFFEKSKDLENITEGLILSGEVSGSLQHDYAQAANYYERAAAIARQIKSPEYTWRALTGLGIACLRLNREDQAKSTFLDAINAIENLRQLSAGGPNQERYFFGDRLGPYSQMIGLLTDQGKIAEALQFAEKAKARMLVDVLASGKVDVTRSMKPEEREKEQQLRNHLSSLNIQMVSERAKKEPDAQLLSELEGKLDRARSDLNAFEDELYASHPELGVHRGSFKPVTLGQIGDLAKGSDAAILAYVVQEDRTLLFVLTNNASHMSTEVKAYKIEAGRKRIAELVNQFRAELASRSLGYRGAATGLYDLLIEPAASELKGKKKLIIVPDAALWQLPFQALESRQGRFLIENSAISYAPSLTALSEMMKTRARQKDNSGRKALLAMGNPAIAAQESAGVKETFRGAHLGPLPDAERQVEALAKMYGTGNGAVYVGEQASEERFKAEAGKYRVIDLATHAIINDSNPMYSQIVLARGGQTDDDGLLDAWEIMDLDLHADVVVLSACETGLGEVQTGEGVVGLSWAVFVAGCPTTVVSQWKVESASTTELMIEFHKRMLAGETKADALRDAQLKLLKTSRYRNPFYWAPFVIVGDAN